MTTQIAKSEEFKNYFEERKQSLELIGNRLLTGDVLLKLFYMAIGRNPILRQCSMPSLWNCLQTAKELSLRPGGARAQIHFIPFKNKGVYEATAILDYRGMIAIAKRCNPGLLIEARTVFKGDEFEVILGTDPSLRHLPGNDRNPNDITGFYAVATLQDGRKQFDWMTKDETDRVRACSRAGQSQDGPWTKWYEMMGRKTVVKRLCNLLEQSEIMVKALEIDDRVETGNSPIVEGELIEGEEPESRGAEAIKDHLRKGLKEKDQRVLPEMETDTE